MVMRKGYVTNHWTVKNQPARMDFSFDSHANNAMVWETKEEAKTACTVFNNYKVRIPSAEGGFHTCFGFKSEARRPGEFVVFCEAPFVLKQAGAR
jgi:hypothetical protein